MRQFSPLLDGGSFLIKTMIVHVTNKADPFARVPKAMQQDKRLSWKAKGILGYLAGKPNDWRIQIDDIVNQSTDGASSVYSAMKELQKKGYAKLVTIRKGQRISGKDWKVRTSLDRGFLDLEKLDQGNNHHTKNDDTTVSTKNDCGAKIAPLASFGLNGYASDDSPEAKLARRFHRLAAKHHWTVGKAKPQFIKWKLAAATLLERRSRQRVKQVLDWYSENHQDPYTPTATTMMTFVDRFTQIEKAMVRAHPDRKEKKIIRERVVLRDGTVKWQKTEVDA